VAVDVRVAVGLGEAAELDWRTGALVVALVVLGVQLPPPVLLSQMWKCPVLDSSFVVTVVGVNVQVEVLMLGTLLPDTRLPSVTVSVALLFDAV
jgi:hypothetical protein